MMINSKSSPFQEANVSTLTVEEAAITGSCQTAEQRKCDHGVTTYNL